MSGVPGRLVEFVEALREHGIPAGPSETVDAAAALEVLGLASREQMREGLAAALVRRGGQRAVFDATFDIYFPLGVGAPSQDPVEDLTTLRDRLASALAANDQTELTQLAGLAVDMLGEYGGTAGTGGWSAHQTLERLQPQTLVVRVLEAIRAGGQEDFTDRLDRDDVRRRVEGFRGLVRTEARRRVAEVRGRERVSRHAVPPAADRVDFLLASLSLIHI